MTVLQNSDARTGWKHLHPMENLRDHHHHLPIISTRNSSRKKHMLKENLPTQTTTNSHSQQLCRGNRRCILNKTYFSTNILNVAMHATNAVLKPDTGDMQEYRKLIKGKDKYLWIGGNRKEVTRLAHGRKDRSITGADTIVLKHPKENLDWTHGHIPSYGLRL